LNDCPTVNPDPPVDPTDDSESESSEEEEAGESWDGLYYWSEPSTWPEDRVPRDGENATIPQGKTVILDIPTNDLDYLQVHGSLIAIEDAD